MAGEPNTTDSETWGSPEQSVQLGYGPAYHGDRLLYRVVAITLALVALGSLAASILLTMPEMEIPQSIVALGSTAVGALAGVLITGKG